MSEVATRQQQQQQQQPYVADIQDAEYPELSNHTTHSPTSPASLALTSQVVQASSSTPVSKKKADKRPRKTAKDATGDDSDYTDSELFLSPDASVEETEAWNRKLSKRDKILEEYAYCLDDDAEEIINKSSGSAEDKRVRRVKERWGPFIREHRAEKLKTILDHHAGHVEALSSTEAIVPSQILKLRRGLYQVAQKWWQNEPIRADIVRIENINSKIVTFNKTENEKEAGKNQPLRAKMEEEMKEAWPRELERLIRSGDLSAKDKKAQESAKNKFWVNNYQNKIMKRSTRQDEFPAQMIQDQIKALAELLDMISELDGSEDPEDIAEREESATKLIEGAVLFQEQLRRMRIDPALIIPSDVRAQFNSLKGTSPEMTKKFDDFLHSLNTPTLDQMVIWSEAKPAVETFIRLASPESINDAGVSTELDSLQQAIVKSNQELATINKECALEEQDHLIPIDALVRMRQFAKRNIGGTRRESQLKKMRQYFLDLGQEELANIIHTERKQIQPPPPAITQPRPPLSAVPPPQMRPPPISVMGTSEPSPQTLGTSLPLLYDDDDGTLMILPYEDGITEYGTLEATRACRTDNARLSRFIVNGGTEARPFYRVVRGTDLGPGGAETLHRNDSKHVRFNLTGRKRHMKATKTSTIKAVGPCVELTRAQPSTRLTKKGKPFRDDLYIRVEYHADKAKNPGADLAEYPNVEWLSRTEFGQLAGKKFADNKEAIMLGNYKTRKQYFDACKDKGIHPDTQNPLTNEDRSNQPWLFKDGNRGHEVDQNEEGDQMSGVEEANNDDLL